jgi:hypothetical protein
MIDRTALRIAVLLAPVVAGIVGCTGIPSDVRYPSDVPDVDTGVVSPEGEANPDLELSHFKFRADMCRGFDTHAITASLTQDDFTRFLEAQGLKITAKKARDNLTWYDFASADSDVALRLRLAVLPNAAAAANDLHASLLEHGPGWWGVRRSNLAILAPKADLREAVAFAIKLRLPCWGLFTYAGLDDAYVAQGPYTEL